MVKTHNVGNGTKVVIAQMQAPKRRSSGRRGSRKSKGGRRGAGVESTVDNVSRGVAGAQSVAMMTRAPVGAAVEASSVKEALSNGVAALADQEPGVYLEAQLPRIANSAGIAGRKLLERAGRKFLGGR